MKYKKNKSLYSWNLMKKISILIKQNKIKYYLKQIYKKNKNVRMILL